MADTRRRTRIGGFSLVETAIVLGIVSVIFAGLWIAVSHALEYVKRERAVEAVTAVVTNMRSYCVGGCSQSYLNVSSPTLTTNAIKSNLIPSFLVRGSTGCTSGFLCADTPWGISTSSSSYPTGGFQLCTWETGWGCLLVPDPHSGGVYRGSFLGFGVVFYGLNQQACIELVEAVSSPTGPTGLLEININGTNLLSGAGKPIQPVSDADANKYCSPPSPPAIPNITFVYRLIAPTP